MLDAAFDLLFNRKSQMVAATSSSDRKVWAFFILLKTASALTYPGYFSIANGFAAVYFGNKNEFTG